MSDPPTDDTEYRYGITALDYHPSNILEIPKSRYENLAFQLSVMSFAITVEENFDAVCENYFELENELMFIIHREMLFSVSNAEYYTINGKISRRVLNFLSSTRLYIDQLPSQVAKIFGTKSAPERDVIKNHIKWAYDDRLGYRALEALRNYSQHYAHPIHNTIFGSSWSRMNNRPTMRHSISPRMNIDKLAADGKFKKSVLDELRALGEEIQFKPLVRDYMEGLGQIHGQAREIIKPALENAKMIISAARSDYICRIPLGSAKLDPHLYLASTSTPHNLRDFLFIPSEFTLLSHFTTKNSSLINLRKRHITSEDD